MTTFGPIETGNRPWIGAEVTAPSVPGHTTDASTAITFTLLLPNGSLSTPVSSPNTDIVGPVAGTKVVDGVTLTTTTWFWKMPLLALTKIYTGRWNSTAGVIAQRSFRVEVPSYAPFATP